jgi:hypothetical protein
MIREMMDLEAALLYDADFDAILADSHWETVYDDRKEGRERFAGVFTEWCGED